MSTRSPDGDGQGPARPPLADDDDEDRHAQPGHLAQVARDRLRLAALLRADPRETPPACRRS